MASPVGNRPSPATASPASTVQGADQGASTISATGVSSSAPMPTAAAPKATGCAGGLSFVTIEPLA